MSHQAPILLIIGTRPEGIKMMPVYFALKKAGLPVIICSTMQHDQLLQDVFDLFGVTPDIALHIMRLKQDLFYVTQSLLQKLKETYTSIKPAMVLVQGDTTSAMVGALSAFYLNIPVGHIEAGLRTHDVHAPFPEEMNRKVIATFCQLHFAPTNQAVQNLKHEGIPEKNIFCTGNTVVDALLWVKDTISQNEIVVDHSLKDTLHQAQSAQKKIILLTMHRRESFQGGIKRVLETIYSYLAHNEDVICIYPFHPNPHVIEAIRVSGLTQLPNCYLSEPFNYQDMVYVLDAADLVITDSGGIQEEAVSLGTYTLVLREKTERQEGINQGVARLVGTDREALSAALEQEATTKHAAQDVYGDGFAAEKIVGIIKRYLQHASSTDKTSSVAPKNNTHAYTKQSSVRGIMKNVTVVGLGYIGLPTAIICAQSGYNVHGYDIDHERVTAINDGEPIIQEPDLYEKLHIVRRENRFSAGTQLISSDYFIIAVPTPCTNSKQSDLTAVFAAAESIGAVLKKGDTVILESTVPVGTTDRLAQALGKQTDMQAGIDFFVTHCPERVLPGNILYELVHNDRIIGGVNKASVQAAKSFYTAFVTGALYETDAKSAEMVKLIENSSRDVDIAFAHQVASMAYAVGLNPYQVIELANKHPRVNILQPSCGVGGHCIAVDPWFLIETFPDQTKLLQAARNINDGRPLQVVEYIYKAVRQQPADGNATTVLLMGLTYKPDVDDLRESPAVRIANFIKEHGTIRLLVCEPHLHQEKVASLYPEAAISMTEGLKQADIVVFLVGHTRFKAIDAKLLKDKQVLDFCGIMQQTRKPDETTYWPAQSVSFFIPDHYSAGSQTEGQDVL